MKGKIGNDLVPAAPSGSVKALKSETSNGTRASYDLTPGLIQLIEHVPIEELRPYNCNARRHSKKQLRKIAASIQEFGFVVPVLVERGGTLIAGHGSR